MIYILKGAFWCGFALTVFNSYFDFEIMIKMALITLLAGIGILILSK